MAMRPSTVLLLLIVTLFAVSISSKRIIRKGKVNPAGKNKVSDKNKFVKKVEVPEESEESSSEYQYSDEEKHDDSDEDDEEEEHEEDEESEEDTREESDTESTEEAVEHDQESDAEVTDESLSVAANEEFKGEKREDLLEKGIFYSLEDIKAYLRQPMFQGDTEIEDLLKRFNNSEVQAQEKLAAYRHKPLEAFYVVEGVNSDTRRKVAQTLAHRLKGLYLVNQPRILLGPVPKEAKRAYYALSKYAIANKVLLSLFHKPVVIESYWTEHASYVMSKVWPKAVMLPSPQAEVYTYPEDLLKPNVTFGIFNTPPPRIGKGPSKSYLREQRQLLVYKRIIGARIHIIRFPESAKQISDKVDMFLLGQGPRKTPVSFEITLAE